MAPEHTYENPAAEYLEQAIEAFMAPGGTPATGPGSHQLEVERRLRLATLFAAFSCEAYANAFLAFALDAQNAASLDRKPTPEKYVLGPEALGETPQLSLGANPLQSVARLFKERDRIVHARPERRRVAGRPFELDPQDCARWIIAVADSVHALSQALEASDFMGPLEQAHDLGDEIDLEPGMIEAERTYFFTGGLVHAIRESRSELTECGSALNANQPVTADAARQILGRARELEDPLWV